MGCPIKAVESMGALKTDPRRMALDLLVTARKVLGSSLFGWIDPHGKFYPLPGGSTHEEFARRLWIGKTELSDTRGPYWGSDRMYENGWFRVVPYGSNALSAYCHCRDYQLTQSQVATLRDMAIEAGMERVMQDIDRSFKPVWVDEELSRVARQVLAIAREFVGFEFPSQDALDKYLKDHPKAKRENHWVKNQKLEKKPQDSQNVKTEKKIEDIAKGKFQIPAGKSMKFDTPGDLGDIDKWKAKIILGNSMTKDKKVGQMDAVGYVGINTRTNEIVPIARSDEHQAGYELLWHLSDKGEIKGSPEDFVTLFPSTNYPHYCTKDTHKYAAAVKKWLDYGGPNVVVHAQNEGLGKRGCYVTDMEEYAALDGKVPYGQKGPSKPAREILDHLDGAMSSLREGNFREAADHAKKLIDRVDVFSSYAVKEFDAVKEFKKSIDEAESDGDAGKLGKTVRGIAKALQESLKEERSQDHSYVPGFFGTGDEADKRLEKAAGAEMGLAKKGLEETSISSSGQNVLDHLEKAAKAARPDMTNPAFAPGRIFDAAGDLVLDLQPMVDDVEGLGPALERLHRAVGGGDVEEVKAAMLSFNGVKNLLHNRLRQMDKDGKSKDKHFGDVKKALEEFERLGQI